MPFLLSAAASLYLTSHRVFRVLLGSLQALFEGFWMGMLPESVYDVISEKSYGEGTKYTNDPYLDSGFHFWEELIIGRYFPLKARVLVAAAGGGRELIALVRAGFGAAGFECSPPMVEAGKLALARRNIAATLEWAPPCVAPAMEGSFNALIVGWNGYCYISPRARRIEFLRSLREKVLPGSPMLVSVAIRTPGARVTTWTPRIANAVRRATLRKPVFETGDTFDGRPKLYFTRKQLAQELRDAGYTVTDYYAWGGYGAMVARTG